MHLVHTCPHRLVMFSTFDSSKPAATLAAVGRSRQLLQPPPLGVFWRFFQFVDITAHLNRRP